MKQVMKMLLVLLGVMLGFAEPVFGQLPTRKPRYIDTIRIGETIPIENINDRYDRVLSAIRVITGEKKNGILFWIKTKGEIIEFDKSIGPEVIVQKDRIGIIDKGTYGIATTIKVPGTEEVYEISQQFDVNYFANLLYGEQSEVDIGRGESRTIIPIESDKDLEKVVGVPTGLFKTSWWRIAISPSDKGELIGEGIISMTVGEILNKYKEKFPNHRGEFYLKTKFSDGLKNYDENYNMLSHSTCSVKIVDKRTPPPPTVWNVRIEPLQNGSITASPDKASAGTSVELRINPAQNYRLKEGSLVVRSTSGQSIPVSNNRFVMPESEVRVSAQFEPIPPTVWSVRIEPLQNGSITASPDKASAGTSVELRINPAQNYRLKEGSLVVRSTSGQNIPVSNNRFVMPESEVRVSAQFEMIPPANVPITALSLGREAIKLKAGSEHQLQLTITPANTTDSKVFTWKSSNPAVMEVVDGKLIAKELGLSTISVEAQNGVKAELLVVIDQSRDDEQFKLPHILGLKDRNDGAVMHLQNQNFQFFWADAQEVQKFAFLCERKDGKTVNATFQKGENQTLKLDAGQWKLTITLDAGTANEQIVTYPVIIAEQEKR